jgi:hypothetical protein
MDAAFTPAGTLTYDPAIDFFSLRYEIRTDDSVPAEGRADADAIAEQRAVDDLRRAGFTHGPLKVTSTDMADMWSDS